MTQEDLQQIGDLVKSLLTQELAPINQRLDSLEQSVSKLEYQVGYLHTKLLEHDKKFEEMDENMRQWKNEILISNSEIMEELRMAREDRLVHLKGSHDRMDKTLKNHEFRIIKLEQPVMQVKA